MKIKRIIAIAFTYVGAVVGAGFSSGREIWLFFARHNCYGFWGIIAVAMFFIILAPIFFWLGRYLNEENYHSFFYNHFPRWGAYFFDILYSLFLAGSTGIMLAGGGSVFQDVLNISYIGGVFITLSLVVGILLLKRDGIFILNSIIIPILVIVTIVNISTYLLKYDCVQDYLKFFERNIKINNWEWLKDSILYGAYNLSIASAVMMGIVCDENENNIITGTILGGSILFLLSFMIYLILTTAFNYVYLEEIPLLMLSRKTGKLYYVLYIFILYFAMVTTAVSNLYSFNKRCSVLLKMKYNYSLILTLIIIIPLSLVGFSELVGYLYPFFGYLGIIIVVMYLYIFWREVISIK